LPHVPCLLYLDGHVDLNTPATTPTGIFDGMGLAHIIGAADEVDELSRIGPRYPLLPDDKIALVGYNPRGMSPPSPVKQGMGHSYIDTGYYLTDVNRLGSVGLVDERNQSPGVNGVRLILVREGRGQHRFLGCHAGPIGAPHRHSNRHGHESVLGGCGSAEPQQQIPEVARMADVLIGAVRHEALPTRVRSVRV
jgi:hypothetical protein